MVEAKFIEPTQETWEVEFDVAASAALRTKTRGKVRRRQDGPQIDTNTVAFNSEAGETLGIVDIFVSGTPAPDGAIDFEVGRLAQGKNIIASTVNAVNANRAKLAKPITIAPNSAISPLYFNLATSTAGLTQFVFLTVVAVPRKV